MGVSKNKFVAALLIAGVVAGLPAVAYAALTADSELTQEIESGDLSTSIRSASGTVVSNPSFAMDPTDVSNSEQSTNGVFGTTTQRIYVDNPGGANDGWTLTLNATNPGSAEWSDGTNTYAYDGTTSTGLLTVDPTAATVTANVGGTSGVTPGASSADFSGGSAITIMSATAGSSDIWNGYITGINLTQDIPASQPAGSYSIDMTQTVAAI